MTILSREDCSTKVWRNVRKHLAARLLELRALNDNPTHDLTKTAAIRGQIAEVKNLLALEISASNNEVPGMPGHQTPQGNQDHDA